MSENEYVHRALSAEQNLGRVQVELADWKSRSQHWQSASAALSARVAALEAELAEEKKRSDGYAAIAGRQYRVLIDAGLDPLASSVETPMRHMIQEERDAMGRALERSQTVIHPGFEPETVCTTCGMTNADPGHVFCSNPVHLTRPPTALETKGEQNG